LVATVSVVSLILCLATIGVCVTCRNEVMDWGSIPITQHPRQFRVWLVIGTARCERWYPFVASLAVRDLLP
jgi:hypothetical protein